MQTSARITALRGLPPAPRDVCKPNSEIVFVLREELGHGASAVVIACEAAQRRADGPQPKRCVRFAAKLFKGCPATHPTLSLRWRVELTLQIACHDHPNIVTCYDWVRLRTGQCAAIMQFARDGDLFDFVRANGPLRVSHARTLARQLASAVAFMHARHVAHRDIKPENVLLDGHYNALLTDFGHAVKWDADADAPLSAACGTLRCVPPEVAFPNPRTHERKYNPMAVDVFELGNVVHFMLTGKFVFEGRTPEHTLANIVQGDVGSRISACVPSDCHDLLVRALHPEPTTRATIEEVLAHPFLSSPVPGRG